MKTQSYYAKLEVTRKVKWVSIMQKIMSQIMNEGFEGGSGSLDFSCVRIELTLAPGACFEGTFEVYGSGECGTYGYVTSTDSRMECLTGEFCGSQDTISYRFHAKQMEAGKDVEGFFYFISNHGEYELPFAVHIELPLMQSSEGEIRNLAQFANLARVNWAEAVKLFYAPEFYGLLRGNDRKYYDLYRGLCASVGNQQNVEEFLISCGKKTPIQYSVEQEKLKNAGELSAVAELALTIRKDGWGYTGLSVVTSGEFVFVEKEFVTEDDFLGNQCTLPVYIDSSLLRKGRNFGEVRLCDAKTELVVPVEITLGKVQGAYDVRLERDKLLVELTDQYQQHRLGQIGAAIWLNQTGRIVERLVSMNEKDVAARLFQAQLLIAQGRQHEAGWLLTHSMELMERTGEDDPDLMAYYLYLTTRINQDKEYFRRVSGQIEELYRRNKTSWRIAWLMMTLTPRYRNHPVEKWELLERQFKYGCNSPVWYMEALLTLNENPALLRRLEEYEIQVLFYGIRKGLLCDELLEQFLYLAGKKREFSPVLLRLLMRCYEKWQDERLLREICVQLIKGGRTDAESFIWYEKGVEQELRLTRLYEYYILSMDLNKEHEISRKALMYFAWQTNLDYEHTAYLYCYLLRNREKYGEVWEQYRERVEHFVVDQIIKEHINPHLAYLYQELLTQAMFSGQLAISLAKLLFHYKITVETAGISKVLVVSPDMESIREYPVANGVAYASLYGDKDTVILEDTDRNRYVQTLSHKREKLMNPAPFLEWMALYVAPGQAAPEFDRCLWEQGRKQKELSQDTVERGKYLLKCQTVSPFIRNKIQLKLLNHYRSNQDGTGLDACLEQVRPDVLDDATRAEVIENLVLREKCDRAFAVVGQFGGAFVDPGVLVKLCEWKIDRDGMAEDKILTNMAVIAFEQHKYSQDTLCYLADHLEGRVCDLEAVRKAACGYRMDLSGLCGRLLVQMLFTGVKPEEFAQVLRYYLKHGEDVQIKKLVLSGCAHAYLTQEEIPDPMIFDEIGRLYAQGEECNSIEKLAYLKYCGKEGLLEDDTLTVSGRGQYEADTRMKLSRGVARSMLSEFLKQGICLNVFRELSDCEDLLMPYGDKTIVECQEKPGTRVTIHYAIRKADGQMDAYRREEMSMAPGGIFFKEFVLFFGESLQYYFTKESDRQTQVSQLMSVSRDERWEAANGRFSAINEMLECESLDAFERLDRQLEDFQHREYLGSSLFTLR